MINSPTQSVIDLNKIKVDPLTCASCINWNEIRTISAKDDWEQGRLLVAETFIDINWQDYSNSITALIPKILRTLPQNKQYQYVTQGFSDTLIVHLMKVVRKRPHPSLN
ncbi:hypothetical protein MNBD_GAMMA11-821 [hydrothermal vent metagenome]|uniref:Uncharacterized protein n=1 Tax=hydrothermal vent metagenome TaxID=652676 RepID=A0A3B0Y889_9ZZZZ